MNILYDTPPNWESLKANLTFDIDHVVFTYGETIYVPNPTNMIDSSTLEHERVHMLQQEEIGGPEIWWDRFIKDKRFRLEQELEAYRHQFLKAKEIVPDREDIARLLHILATDLSSAQYGNVVAYLDARKLIQGKMELPPYTQPENKPNKPWYSLGK